MPVFSMNCPEVNGALAAFQEMEEEGEITNEEAEKAAETWLKEHSDECPFCKREAAERPRPKA